METLVLQSDGAARGNPGRAGAGAVLFDASGAVVAELRRDLGIATNNRAEYEALLMGLEAARAYVPDELVVRLDSELVVKQLRGEYRVKSAALRPLVERALLLLRGFPRVRVEHVPRSGNAHADRLANEAIDGSPDGG